MPVIRRHSSPRRIIAVSKNGETFSLDHQAIVTAIARIAVPAITGYFGNSVHLGAGRIMPKRYSPAACRTSSRHGDGWRTAINWGTCRNIAIALTTGYIFVL